MDYQSKLMEHLQVIVGNQLDALNMAYEMMMFSFEKYALHTQCLARIIYKNDILVTTWDYQSWDGEVEENNDEWYFVEQNRAKIIGGTVTSVNINALHDVVITLDNGIGIELFIKNGYHHFDDEHEQLVNEMKKLLTIVLMFLGGLSMVGCNQQSQQIQSNQLLAKGNVINIDVSSLPEGYNYSFGGEDVKPIIDYLSDLNLDSKFEENPDQ